MSLQDFLKVPEVAARYRKVKPYFSLRTSTYDVSADCQLRCQGCSYFASPMSEAEGVRDPEKWRELMLAEKARGINFVNLAGAEPSLFPAVLRACHDVIPQGIVVTNGLKPIAAEIDRYNIHISLWGDSNSDPAFRPYLSGKRGDGTFATALRNYANDSRAIFVYTFNAQNTDDVDEPAARIVDAGLRLTFSVFTSHESAEHPALRVGSALERTRDKMLALMDRYPQAVVYSRYNAEVHTNPKGLRELLGCVFPRAARAVAGTVSSTYRSYRADLTHLGEGSCCTPYQSCSDCRVYAAGAVIVPAQFYKHAHSESAFRAWLDYVDTYLAVFVSGYRQDRPLYTFEEEGVCV